MFEQDYLMRMILQLIEAINRSMERARGERGTGVAAELLDEAIGAATEIDGEVLLNLAPASIADILSVSGTDPAVIEYVAHSLSLSSQYWREAGDARKADLRAAQADALARSYGFEIQGDVAPDAAMRAFLESRQPEKI